MEIKADQTNCVFCNGSEPQLSARVGLKSGLWHIDCLIREANRLSQLAFNLSDQMKQMILFARDQNTQLEKLTLKNAELKVGLLNNDDLKKPSRKPLSDLGNQVYADFKSGMTVSELKKNYGLSEAKIRSYIQIRKKKGL